MDSSFIPGLAKLELLLQVSSRHYTTCTWVSNMYTLQMYICTFPDQRRIIVRLRNEANMHSLYLRHNMCIFTISFVKDEQMVQKCCGVVPTLFGCFMGILPLHALVMISIPLSHSRDMLTATVSHWRDPSLLILNTLCQVRTTSWASSDNDIPYSFLSLLLLSSLPTSLGLSCPFSCSLLSPPPLSFPVPSPALFSPHLP